MSSDASSPQPIAQGTLETTPFAHLLVSIEQRKLSGTLAIWGQDADASQKPERVRFEAGWPIGARVQHPASSFERSLLPLFQRTSGLYAFYREDLMGTAPGMLTGRVDPFALCAISLRGFALSQVVAQTLQRLGSGRVRLRPHVNLARFGFTGAEVALVEVLAAQPCRVDTLVQETTLPTELARRIVYLLAITDAIEAYVPATIPSVPTPTSRPPMNRASPRPSVRPVAPHESNPPPPLPNGLPDDLAVRWREITTRYRDIDHQTHFQVLGLATDASTQEVKNAYYQQVKVWHPDRLPEPLSALRPVVDTIFGLLSQAHDVLSDEQKRAAYLRSVQAGGGTPRSNRLIGSIVESALAYQKVEVAVRRHQYADALERLQQVLEANPDEADYHAMHAWLLLQCHPGPDAPLASMLEAANRALALNEAHEKAHYVSGLILKRMDRMQDALRHFRRAVEVNPRHTDAQRELRLAAMRQQRKTPSERPVGRLLSRLFKKP